MKKFWFGLGLILLVAGVFMWRSNGIHASTLKDQILSKDQSGQAVSADIKNLQNYSAAHMGASVNFILLGSYQRALTAAQAQSQPQANNPQIYAEAQAACASHADSITQANCVINYVNAHQGVNPAAGQPTTVTPPDKNKYSYAIHSPFWSPDAAGWLLGGGVISLIIAVIVTARRPRTR